MQPSEPIKTHVKMVVLEMLEKFYFVRWDRYIKVPDRDEYAFYGWIDREKDAYKDFILLEYRPTGLHTYYWLYTTSSAERDAEIEMLVDGTEGKGIPCQRTEYLLPELSNAIHLK